MTNIDKKLNELHEFHEWSVLIREIRVIPDCFLVPPRSQVLPGNEYGLSANAPLPKATLCVATRGCRKNDVLSKRIEAESVINRSKRKYDLTCSELARQSLAFESELFSRPLGFPGRQTV